MSKEQNSFFSGKLGKIIIGILIGVAVTLMLMLLFALITVEFDIDRSLSKPFATVSIAAGTFVAALFAAKSIGDKGYLIGLAVGFAVFLAVTVISIAVSKSGLTINSLFHFLIIILSSLIGGIVGVNSGKSKKYI